MPKRAKARKKLSMRLLPIVMVVLIVLLLTRSTSMQSAVLCKGEARCFNGTVTEIVDGDSLAIDNVSIRLALIDAPEYNTPVYNESRGLALSVCPVGSNATVDEDDGQTVGSYGRIVAVVYCDGMNLNAEMLARKKALLYKEFCNVSEFASESWTGC